MEVPAAKSRSRLQRLEAHIPRSVEEAFLIGRVKTLLREKIRWLDQRHRASFDHRFVACPLYGCPLEPR